MRRQIFSNHEITRLRANKTVENAERVQALLDGQILEAQGILDDYHASIE